MGARQDTQDPSYSFLTPFNVQHENMTKKDQLNCKSEKLSAFTDAYRLSHYLMPRIKNTIQSVESKCLDAYANLVLFAENVVNDCSTILCPSRRR